MSIVERIVALANAVQALPYRWPSPPTADSARRDRSGSCASKHALLADELAGIGIRSRPLLCVGPLIPTLLANRDDFVHGADLLEVHELLTVDVPDIGPCRVDITWDPPLIRAGLPGTLDWTGTQDMTPAVGEVHDWYAPDPEGLRSAKEALRRRLYHAEQRANRDRLLEAMSVAFGSLRNPASASAAISTSDAHHVDNRKEPL